MKSFSCRVSGGPGVGFHAANGPKSNVSQIFESKILLAQEKIVAALESIDGSKFHVDIWERNEGGGGRSMVLQSGNVWEKAGVNVSTVHGVMPAEAYKSSASSAGFAKHLKGIPVPNTGMPFLATGISSVMHPINPFAPTVHFNFRYFELFIEGKNSIWWFGGGADITPYYIDQEDVHHFHKTFKEVCDQYSKTYYQKFKQWADDYFYIAHRQERRGLGGIFFDDLNDQSQSTLCEFATSCLNKVTDAYLPIVRKHMNDAYTDKHRKWQAIRRGRYVEFNLVYDRGTTFGLKTNGRIESILMSLPPLAAWEYNQQPEVGSQEWELLQKCRNPVDWVV